MRIMLLSSANSSHTVKWANILSRRGHEILLVSLPNHPAKEGALLPEVQVNYLEHADTLGYFRNTKQLKEIADRYKPDVINVHYASGYGTLSMLAKLHPVLLSVWGSDVYSFPYRSPLHSILLEKNISAADAVASTSAVMAKQTAGFIKGKKRIFLTPFGVDTTVFSPRPHKKINCFIVGAVKRLEPECGIERLLKAFKLFRDIVHDEDPARDVRLVIYGHGSDHITLLGLAKMLGISTDTLFYGEIENSRVPLALSQMDIVCLPSLRESFGVSALEAMACEKAVVTSDADGFLETVENGVSGIIVKNLNEKKLAETLLILYKNKGLREKLGKAGRERVLKLYTQSDCAEKLEAALEYTASLIR